MAFTKTRGFLAVCSTDWLAGAVVFLKSPGLSSDWLAFS
ncbi:hypothetical protein D1AOALGA4SA_13085 [Olavius algarvensis Delta 1 endosymbiont]|nr:hypothetical protein D1AOALGA4SA_13085 [Olavius algarvensis Delta 1 endosymbiont]